MNRRSSLKTILATGIAPWIVPAHVLRSQTAPSNKITLGVIGCGSQGMVDLRAFLNHDDVRVVALCDVNRKNIEKANGYYLKEKYGKADARVYSDFRELNRDPGVDAVLMALPVHWHSIPSADAVLNGKHIYHEKPMALSLQESKLVRAAVKKMGVTFQFGTQQRSDLKFRWAAELAQNGRLGKLREIQVGVPGGKTAPVWSEQAVPEHVDWDRWVGPAPMSSFHEEKLKRDNHENIRAFSLGMISCWGIHHLDIAQWGNGTDGTGPVGVEGSALYPESGGCDTALSWQVRFEYAAAAPILFANESAEVAHGARFIGEKGWVHVRRGAITASDPDLLRDPANKVGTMPIKLPISLEHTRNFVDAIQGKAKAICDIETAVRSDTLPQLASICLKTQRKLTWNPEKEDFGADQEANRLMQCRELRGDWKLPVV